MSSLALSHHSNDLLSIVQRLRIVAGPRWTKVPVSVRPVQAARRLIQTLAARLLYVICHQSSTIQRRFSFSVPTVRPYVISGRNAGLARPSVRPSVGIVLAPNWKTKRCGGNRIGVSVRRGNSKRRPNSIVSRKVKGQDFSLGLTSSGRTATQYVGTGPAYFSVFIADLSRSITDADNDVLLCFQCMECGLMVCTELHQVSLSWIHDSFRKVSSTTRS